MATVNRLVTGAFDALLYPLELLGRPAALVLASAVFGVLALWIFKHTSPQRAIGAVKDRLQGHVIEIRLYQDDLAAMARAVGRVLLHNLRYLGLNLLAFLPLVLPFAFVLAQLVVRYAFDPAPVATAVEPIAGRGSLLSIELAPGRADLVSGLRVHLPEGVQAASPLVRSPREGRAYQELVALAPDEHAIEIEIDGARETKTFVAGTHVRTLQPERARGIWGALLWPAEPPLDAASPFQRIALEYPDSELGFLPGGVAAVVLVFLAVSMLAGFAALRPLGVRI